jgi:hypothetical protein
VLVGHSAILFFYRRAVLRSFTRDKAAADQSIIIAIYADRMPHVNKVVKSADTPFSIM